jgi:hypothetical protein
MQVDAIIKVRFKTTAENGRQRAVTGEIYGCPLFIDGEAFDCRLYLEGRTFNLGETYEVGIRFLNPQWALPLLAVGKRISLWEGKEVASGEVLRIDNKKINKTEEMDQSHIPSSPTE